MTAIAMGVLALSNTASASATTYSSAWNESPSKDQCLAAAGNTVGVRAVMWWCYAQGGQEWTRIPVPGVADTYIFKNNNGDCLDASDYSYDTGTPGDAVYVEYCDNSALSQQWSLYGTDANGYREWISPWSDYCLSIAGGSTANGAQPILDFCHTPGRLDQYWGGSL